MLLNNKGSQRPQFCGSLHNIIRNLKGYTENPATLFMWAEISVALIIFFDLIQTMFGSAFHLQAIRRNTIIPVFKIRVQTVFKA